MPFGMSDHHYTSIIKVQLCSLLLGRCLRTGSTGSGFSFLLSFRRHTFSINTSTAIFQMDVVCLMEIALNNMFLVQAGLLYLALAMGALLGRSVEDKSHL